MDLSHTFVVTVLFDAFLVPHASLIVRHVHGRFLALPASDTTLFGARCRRRVRGRRLVYLVQERLRLRGHLEQRKRCMRNIYMLSMGAQ